PARRRDWRESAPFQMERRYCSEDPDASRLPGQNPQAALPDARSVSRVLGRTSPPADRRGIRISLSSEAIELAGVTSACRGRGYFLPFLHHCQYFRRTSDD